MKKITATALTLSFLTACGPAGPTVNVTLITGLENQGRFKNLMKSLAAAPGAEIAMTAVSDNCVQKNLFAAVSPGDEKESQLETVRIPLKLGYDTAAYTIDSTWVSNYSSFEPVVLPVPRGIPVGIGIIGALTASERTDANDGSCADFDTNSPPQPYASSSLIGHRRIVANSAMEVPLKVWVTPITAAPSPTPAAGDPNCADDSDSNQNCPTLDFFKLVCSGCSTEGRHLQLEYAPDRTDPNRRVIQWIRSSLAATTYIPNILPIKITVHGSGPVKYASRLFTRSDFDGINGGGLRTVTKVFTSAETSTSSTIQLLLTEYPR